MRGGGFGIVLGGLVGLIASLASTVALLLATAPGTALLLRHLPGVVVTAPRGSLLGGNFAADRIAVRLRGADSAIVVERLAWTGLRVDRSDAPHGWLKLTLTSLQAAQVQVALPPSTAPADTTRLQPPADLRLPFEVVLDRLAIGTLRWSALGDAPVQDIAADLHLGAGHGTEHRFTLASARWNVAAAHAQGRIATSAPFDLTAQLQVAQGEAPVGSGSAAAAAASATPTGQVDITLQGPLARLALAADLQVRTVGDVPTETASQPRSAPAKPTAAPQTLRVQALLTPFAAWPLAALTAEATAFDLSALLPTAPATALTGRASTTTAGYDQPATVHLVLDNTRAGRWNDNLLPIRHLQADLVATPSRGDTVELRALDAAFGDRTAGSDSDAGSLHASGQWTAAGSRLNLQLDNVQPALLDLRAPAMRVDGHADLALRGSTVDAKADLNGALTDQRLPSTPRTPRGSKNVARPPFLESAVRLQFDASAGPQTVSIRAVRLEAGTASASVHGEARRDAAPNGRWTVDADATLARFDPLLWWPGASDPAWRGGATQLNAESHWHLTGVDLDSTLDLPQRLDLLRGSGTLKLADSTLVGLPVSSDMGLRRNGAAPAELALHAVVAGNSVDAAGRFAERAAPTPTAAAHTTNRAASRPAPMPVDDAWTVRVDAPDLSRLVPLWPLVGTSGSPSPAAGKGGTTTAVGGSVQMQASVNGRWPTLATQGSFQAAALHAGDLRVRQAQGHWTLSTSATAPADLQATVDDAAAGAAAVDHAELQLQGSGRAHDLTLRAALKALPPAWVASVQAALKPAAPASGAAGTSKPDTSDTSDTNATGTTTLALTAHGGLVDAGARFGGWRGSVLDLAVRSGGAGDAPLLQARQIGIAYVSGTVDGNAADAGAAASAVAPAGGDRQPASLVVDAGRLDLLGAGLRWSRIAWQAATSAQPMQLTGQIELDPLPVAPFLAQAQPAFGWGGDLTVSAHADIHSTPAFGAEIVVERHGGDLTVTDDTETRALALTTLRIALDGHDGVWRLTHAVAGNALGVLAGAVSARAPAGTVWPAAESPLDGLVTLQVASLGSLGGWVPPGWRLSGGLRATATVSGTLGAPQYVGEVIGTGLGVRNFVQGVEITDGELSIALQGATARIEHFAARGGSGTVQLDGGATLGAAPQADLTLTARQFQLLGRVDRRIVVSGDARLTLRGDQLALDGRYGVDEGLIDFTHSDAPTLSDDVRVRRGDETMLTQKEIEAGQAADASGGSLRNVALNLRIGLGDRLRLRGHGLEAGLGGDLQLRSPAGKLTVDGTVRTQGGTYAAYGQKLNIDRGEISFLGNADNPRLDIEAVRPDTDNVRVGVAITGSALDPRVRLFSEPDLSDIDKISMLMLGHTSDGAGGSDMALLQSAALGLFSGEGDGSDGSFTKKLGLDELSVHQGSDNNARDSVVSLGKQISKRWYVGYERGLGATAGSVQLIYRLAQRLTLRAQSGSDNSIDAIWSLRWK